MRVVFMGTPAFAVPSLRALASSHEVALVVTRPDAAGGRGSALRPSEVKQAALELGLPLLQPQTLRTDVPERLATIAPDVICVAAFGMLLPPEVLVIPRFGCINVHASLLPRYRGAAPIQRAVLDAAPTTGVSIMRMEEGLDTGPYMIQRSVEVDARYADDVEADLAVLGAEALVDALDLLETGRERWVTQDDSLATYAAKITKDDVALMPDLSVAAAYARIRAASRRAPARACLGEREVTVVRARPVDLALAPGALCLHDGLPVLGFADGALLLDVLRPAGKADMSGADWARGARLEADACWRCTR